MTDIITSSLRDLAFSTSTVPVLDELAALDALLPEIPDEMERNAALLERLPSLLDLRGRALGHAREYERFLALAEVDPSALEDRVITGNALAILAHAGEIAMLLVPSGSPEDDFAQAMLAKERARQYGAGSGVHAPELMTRALRATVRPGGLRLATGARVPVGMEMAARRFRGEVLPARQENGTGPRTYHLEDAFALEAWFAAAPDLVTLLEESRALFASIEAWSEPEEPAPSWYAARRGALILAYAKLCRVGLWPARSSNDLIAKMAVERLISERAADPHSMRALVEIALGVGRRIARQGPPFVTHISGVAL
ncbi:hypothetical protein [Bosea massiliensis]|uniref:Uncharacterized protein n=1 Tax=Bosea massiliensis TaxID=151419 RepID=A0ABW0P7F8_9HYPH